MNFNTETIMLAYNTAFLDVTEVLTKSETFIKFNQQLWYLEYCNMDKNGIVCCQYTVVIAPANVKINKETSYVCTWVSFHSFQQMREMIPRI